MKTIVVLGFLLVQTLLNYLLIIVISIFFNPFLLSLLKKYNGIFSILIFAAIFFLINVLILLFFRKIWPFVRKNFKNIFLTNLSILFVFILIELLLRQVRIVDTTNEQNGLHSYLSPYEPVNIQKGHIYSHKENSTLTYKTNEFSYIHKMNKDGFRCTDFDTSKGKNEIRIAAIGDSYTEGVGAPQDSTWPGLLEEKLNKTDNGFKYSVINAGIIGSDPIFGFVLLRDKLLKYHPDIVIYTINLSDYLDLRTRGGMERFKPDGIIEYKKGPVWEWLFAISFSTRLVFQGLLHYDNLLQSPADKAATSRKAYRDLLRCSKDFELLGKKYHFITIPVFHPVSIDFTIHKFPGNFPLKYIIEWNPDVYNRNTLNMFEYFKKVEGINEHNVFQYYWKTDWHHNGRGYDAFARGIFRKLTDLK